MYPDPENPNNADYYLPIDYEKPYISRKVQVHVTPFPGDNIKVKGTHNEDWYAHVVTVNFGERIALVKWYLATQQPDVWRLSDNEDNLNFSSIVSLVHARRAPGGPRKFKFVDV